MAKRGEIELGDLVKDEITGFKGIAYGITIWLNGCERVTVQAQDLKDGKPVDGQVFDCEQLIVVKPAAFKVKKHTGGPCPGVSQASTPARR